MDEQTRLVSIIIPIYNAADTLTDCVQSILRQTYAAFELLLVDDGSRDGSDALCRDLSAQDARIRTFSKPNGGASSARNFGLDNALGDYILFVDADDAIPPDHLLTLKAALERSGADIAVCAVRYVPGPTLSRTDALLDTAQAIEAVLYRDGISDYPFGKLYRRALFEGVRFTEGITSEDFELFYRLYRRARSVAVTDKTRYFYMQRAGSVSNRAFNTGFFNRMDVCERLISDVSRDFPALLPAARSRAVDENVWLYGITPRSFAAERARMRRTVRAYAPGVLRDPKATKKVKRKAFLFLLCPALWTLRMHAKSAFIRAAERLRRRKVK